MQEVFSDRRAMDSEESAGDIVDHADIVVLIDRHDPNREVKQEILCLLCRYTCPVSLTASPRQFNAGVLVPGGWRMWLRPVN
jgi:hypothetical protein